MKRKYICICVLLLLLPGILMPAYAEEYLYWHGKADEDSQQPTQLYAWDLTEDEMIPLGLQGYLIESAAEDASVYMVLVEKDELSDEDPTWEEGSRWVPQAHRCDTINIAHISEAQHKETLTLHLPENILKVYAFKNGWLYYAYWHSETNYGIRRANSAGKTQTYDIRDIIDSQRDLINLICSISTNGTLAFISENDNGWADEPQYNDTLYTCLPDGKAEAVKGTVDASSCVWLNENLLLYRFYPNVSEDLYVYNSATETCAPWLTQTENTVSFKNGCLSALHANAFPQYLIYQEEKTYTLLGFIPLPDTQWQALQIVSLNSGETLHSSQQVLLYDVLGNQDHMQIGK